jgi:hypothetical protein
MDLQLIEPDYRILGVTRDECTMYDQYSSATT